MYKKRHPYINRVEEYNRIKIKYPTKIPIICEIDQRDTFLDKSKCMNIKYLVDNTITVGQFMYVVRKRLKLPPEKAVFLMVENRSIPPNGELISIIYEKYKDSDNFLYIYVCSESFFG